MGFESYEWPAWHALQELTAEKLLALEDYLPSRSALADDGLHGVDYFDGQSGLEFTQTGEGLSIRLRRVQGITPAGDPVRLRLSARTRGCARCCG